MRINRKPPTHPHAYALSDGPKIECDKLIKIAMPVGFRLPEALNSFQLVILKTDKTLDRADLQLLTRGLDAFTHHSFEGLITHRARELSLTFSRGRFSRLNEIIVIGKILVMGKGDLPGKFDQVLVSDQADRIGRSDR